MQILQYPNRPAIIIVHYFNYSECGVLRRAPGRASWPAAKQR
jgi:hypothetical protein